MFSLVSIRSAWRRPRAVFSLVGVFAVGLWLCGPGPAYASNIVKAMFYQLVGIGGTSQTARNRLNLVAGSGVTLTPSDNSGTNSTDVTIAASGGASSFYQLLGIGGSSQTQRGRLNLIAGSNITIANSDNSGTDSSDVTITGTGGGSTVTIAPPFLSLGGSLYGPVYRLVDPSLPSWAWANQGTATVTSQNGAQVLCSPSSGGLVSVNMREITAPATPYTVTAAMVATYPNTNFPRAGLAFRESATNKVESVSSVLATQVGVDRWTTPTSFNSTPASQAWGFSSGLLWFRMADNGTNLTFSVSSDGYSFYQVYTEARAAWFTTAPDRISFFVDSNSGATVCTTLISWETT